ncbi:fatty-acid amide hydrolase [Niveomyces insectorum RCEF 264]|uniref:Fatty-acid amide hydrolase n=1 Tax=Niveomyces insectorum RCEF 264 TaxID=1081102 RepID=A0A167YNC1_9HYPO|nr:fatty-acid amide hydrolase [Niveomyces insectorum RCEF 264]
MSKWKELAAKKQAQLAASLPKEWIVPDNLLPPASQTDVTGWPAASGWFTPEELSITEATASELIPKLASGALSSVAVTRAFCKRAVAAQQLLNCLSETCFDRALATAKARDAHLAATGKPVGPLHGLPVSLKDNLNVKGLDSTVGFASHVGDPAADDSTLLTVLEAAGAVPYVKTNVPTAMMIAETVNNVFGRTLNPLHRDVTPGGSSGGESALITFKGSCLGVGSDIGGSLRIPAACTGIFTIRASGGRFPVRNCRSGMPGQEAVMSVNGPLARSLDDVETYTRAVLGGQPWLHDAKCLPIPWRTDVVIPDKLKIGVLWHDGVVRPTPPVARALRTTAERLQAAGHTVVDWDPVDQEEGANLLARMFVADGGKTIQHELDRTGEPLRPEMAAYGEAAELGTAAMWKLHLERSAYQNKYLDRWNAAGIDVLLCPTIPFNTAKHGTFEHVGYTGVYNVLDYACVSFPTGLTVDKAVDQLDPACTPLGPLDKNVADGYDADFMNGLPISLQLVARRLEEEKVIGVCHRVLSVLNK